MRMKVGFLALMLGAATLSTAALAQYGDNPRDDRSGGGYSNQGRSQSHGGGRYDPTTGGRRGYYYDDWDRGYRRGPPPWAYPRWRDDDDFYDRRYRYRTYRDWDDRW